MIKNKRILLVDGENILHQSFHKFEKLKSTDGKPSGAIYGFFKSLHMYITRFNPDRVYVTFDNGHSKFRDSLNPDYKSHRKNIAYDYDSLISQKVVIKRILSMLRISYIYDKHNTTDYEGDDFLAYLCLHFRKNNKVTIVSSDKDFNQLIDSHVKIYNPRKDDIVYNSTCKKLFGYTPEETVDYLCLVGDSSDDIKGFPGMGPVKTRKFLDIYGSIDKALKSLTYTDKEALSEVYERNRKMIDLVWFTNEFPLTWDKLPIKQHGVRKINRKRFKDLCIEYSFVSFMTNEFIQPFENLLTNV